MTSILDHPAVSGRYLFPQPRRVDQPWSVPVEGAVLNCYRHIVDPEWMTLVHFHGNGEAVADYVPDFAEEFAALKLNSLFVEYRQYGGSGGRAELTAMLGDGETVLSAAGVPPDRAITYGRSVGSLYAIELVHRLPQLAGLIIESGIAAPAERFLTHAQLDRTGITEQDIVEQADCWFNHRAKLSNYDGPTLILHTVHDVHVEISHAERNFAWSASADKKLVRFPSGGHNSLITHNLMLWRQSLGGFVDLVAAKR